GNTDIANATLVYHGTTVGAVTWNGYVSGSQKLDGVSAPTENYNQAGVTNTQIPGGFCQSTPGKFWTLDITTDDGFSATGIRILNGTYTSGDVQWTVNSEITPDFNTDAYGSVIISDWNMAFDPTGQYGWIVLLTHLNGLSDFIYHPVFYHTTDGGNTWSGAEQLDINSFSSISSVVADPSCSFEADITVDMNGHPHAFIGVFEYGGYPYSIYQSSLGHLYDFSYNGTAWSANQISPVSYAAFFHSGGMVNNRPQLSRSDD